MVKWNAWHPFHRDIILGLENKLHHRAGVYSLRLMKNGIPKCIDRVNGKDKNGILYYGKSRDLFIRLSDCEGKFRGFRGYEHSGAATYRRYFSKTRWFEHGLIQFRWKFCENDKKAKRLETELIRGYRKRYMDSPPLNSIG